MAWAERTRLEMDAFDVMVPDFLVNNNFKGVTEYLSGFQKGYKRARINVRDQLEDMNLHKDLFNATPEMMIKYVGSMKMKDIEWLETDQFILRDNWPPPGSLPVCPEYEETELFW